MSDVILKHAILGGTLEQTCSEDNYLIEVAMIHYRVSLFYPKLL